MKTTGEILDEELSQNMLDILKDIPLFRQWIEGAMVRYAVFYHLDKLQTLQASTDKSKLNLADVSNSEAVVCDACGCKKSIVLKQCSECGNTIKRL
jgi:hypothetical protein